MNRNQNDKQILVKNHHVEVLSLEPKHDLVKVDHTTILKI